MARADRGDAAAIAPRRYTQPHAQGPRHGSRGHSAGGRRACLAASATDDLVGFPCDALVAVDHRGSLHGGRTGPRQSAEARRRARNRVLVSGRRWRSAAGCWLLDYPQQGGVLPRARSDPPVRIRRTARRRTGNHATATDGAAHCARNRGSHRAANRHGSASHSSRFGALPRTRSIKDCVNRRRLRAQQGSGFRSHGRCRRCP